MPAPTVIAESATLNAQKWCVRQYTSTKSTTAPDDDAIDQVPGSAADDERQPGPRHDLVAGQPRRVDRHPCERRHGDQRDHAGLEREVPTC